MALIDFSTIKDLITDLSAGKDEEVLFKEAVSYTHLTLPTNREV